MNVVWTDAARTVAGQGPEKKRLHLCIDAAPFNLVDDDLPGFSQILEIFHDGDRSAGPVRLAGSPTHITASMAGARARYYEMSIEGRPADIEASARQLVERFKQDVIIRHNSASRPEMYSNMAALKTALRSEQV